MVSPCPWPVCVCVCVGGGGGGGGSFRLCACVSVMLCLFDCISVRVGRYKPRCVFVILFVFLYLCWFRSKKLYNSMMFCILTE